MLADEEAYGHTFLLLPVLLGLGAVIWFRTPFDLPLWPLLALWLAAAAFVTAWRHRPGPARLLAITAALIATGMLLAAAETRRHATVMLDQSVTTVVTGVVDTREPAGEGRWRYGVTLETTGSPTLRRPPQRVSLLSRVRQPPFEIGQRITGRARLSPPSGPALPGLTDFAFSGYFDDIGAIGFFYGAPARVEGTVETGWGQTASRSIFALRSAIGERIRSVVSGDAGAFAAAIVTDERRAISQGTTEALRLSGLAHIVAISGLNMALAAGIFFVGMRMALSLMPGFAQAFPVKKLAAGAALVMATGYYLISGFGVSAERAYIMMAIMLVAVLFDRPSISLRNVALSAIVIVALAPSEILGPSFQMSFAATVALVAGYTVWTRRRADVEAAKADIPLTRSRLFLPIAAGWRMASGIFATSLIGGLSTAIFSLDHFYRMTSYGLAANLAAMPIVSFVVMPFGLIGMLLMPFGLDAPLLKIMGLGLEAVIAVAKTVAGWGGNIDLGRQHPWFLAIATIGFLALTLPRTRLRLLGIPLTAAAILLTWLSSPRPAADFILSEDGTMAALITEARLSTNRTRPPAFIFGQWQRALSLPDPTPPKMLDRIGVAEDGGERRSPTPSPRASPSPSLNASAATVPPRSSGAAAEEDQGAASLIDKHMPIQMVASEAPVRPTPSEPASASVASVPAAAVGLGIETRPPTNRSATGMTVLPQTALRATEAVSASSIAALGAPRPQAAAPTLEAAASTPQPAALMPQAEPTPQAVTPTLQAAARTPQAAASTPQPAAPTPNAAAPTPQAAALTPQAAAPMPQAVAPMPQATPPQPRPKRPPLDRRQVAQAIAAMRAALAGEKPGVFVCSEHLWCVAQAIGGPSIAIVEDARYAGAACDAAQLVVAARARFPACRSGAMMITAETLRRSGALEITFRTSQEPSHWTILPAFTSTARPWQRHRHYDWRRDLFDPDPSGALQAPITGHAEGRQSTVTADIGNASHRPTREEDRGLFSDTGE